MINNLFDHILTHPELSGVTRYDCSENNLSVKFDDLLKSTQDDLNEERVLVLKPDAFYHSRRLPNPPPSPDCLIFVFCTDKIHYSLYLIELRDTPNDTKKLKYKEISAKFQTMINEFFVKFNDIFESVSYRTIKFYLVTSYPKKSQFLSDVEYRERIKGTALDVYASQKPLRLYNKAILIEPLPALTIKSC